MTNLIPGYDYVGKGFDVFSTFDKRALASKLPLFDITVPSAQNYEINGQTFIVPKNAGVMEVQNKSGRSSIFTQKSDVAQFFSVQAGIEGSYLAFSGAFEAAFSSISKNVSEYQFAIYYLYTDAFAVEVENPSSAYLAPSVLEDPDYKHLPTTFNEDNQHLFFRFFHKYGTHFVRSVDMGGRLFYSVSIDKSFNFSEIDFEAKLNLEYQAAFGVAAEAQGNWNRVGQVWSDHRNVTIDAVGGDESILNALHKPTPPENFNTSFQQWIASIKANPGPMNFSLMSVDVLFSGDQADAVRTAIDAYTQNHMLLKATGGRANSATSGSISFNGVQLPQPDFKDGGFTIAVFDRTTLQELFVGSYDNGWRSNDFGQWKGFDTVDADLDQYMGDTNVIVAALFWGQYSIWGYPSRKLFGFLKGCGAGAGLDEWSNYSSSARYESCAYALVGVPGWPKGRAQEVYVGDTTFSYQNIVYPQVELQTFLEPQFIDNEIVYSPT